MSSLARPPKYRRISAAPLPGKLLHPRLYGIRDLLNGGAAASGALTGFERRSALSAQPRPSKPTQPIFRRRQRPILLDSTGSVSEHPQQREAAGREGTARPNLYKLQSCAGRPVRSRRRTTGKRAIRCGSGRVNEHVRKSPKNISLEHSAWKIISQGQIAASIFILSNRQDHYSVLGRHLYSFTYLPTSYRGSTVFGVPDILRVVDYVICWNSKSNRHY